MKNPLKNYLTKSEQSVLLFLIIVGFIGMSLQSSGLLENDAKSVDSLNIEHNYQIKYDLKTVTTEELITVPGIGIKGAADIIEYRNKFGFEFKEDLKKIKGIGDKTYAKMECYFYDFKKKDKVKSQNKNEKININTADETELMKLKGIGPKKAQLILERREILGRFTSFDDLLEVKGIGKKTLEKIKKSITLGD